MPYTTYDNLPDLTPAEMAAAHSLTFSKITDPNLASWQNQATYATVAKYASLSDTFFFNGTAGATYDIVSTSFFDPFLVEAFDSHGNVIAVDDLLSYTYGHASFIAPYTGTFYVNASWHQGTASVNLGAAVGIYENTKTIPPSNFITGTSGNDRILGTAASDVVDGGAGLDTFVLGRQREHYSVVVDKGVITITDLDGLSGSDTLQNVERIQFYDGFMSFETTGVAPQAYRLYQAAFGRTPDSAGLGYWIKDMLSGDSLGSVASAFVGSAEFKSLYGASPTDEAVLTALYRNVLHRVPDAAGHDYWMGLLANHTVTVTDMLVSFSESAENQAQVIGQLNAGFMFTV